MVDSSADQDYHVATPEVSTDTGRVSQAEALPPNRADVPPEGDASQQVSGPPEAYSPLQRRLHWIVAGLVALQLIVGISIGLAGWPPPNDPSLRALPFIHLLTGTLIFALMLRRLALRRQLGTPPSPEGTPLDAVVMARTNHLGFYVLLLVLPVLGWLAYFSEGQTAARWGTIHGAFALVLVLAICAHLAGVAYHTYIRRDGLVHRMWG